MRTFKTSEFAKDAKERGLTDRLLHQAILEVRQGLIDEHKDLQKALVAKVLEEVIIDED